jgi:uncharacterized membrane protein
MIELLALALLVVAVATMRRTKRRLDDLETRFKASESLVQRMSIDIAQMRSRDRPPPAEQERPDAASPDVQAPGVTDRPPDGPRPASVEPVAAGRPGDAEPPPAAPAGGSVPPMPPAAATGGAAPPRPPAPVSLEERLGTRWAVWVGGLALALGGLMLVRYSIEQGWFGPGARIVMGLLLGAALGAAGEWLRRGERRLAIEAIPAAHIPGVLTAAGTATLFGTIYAAHGLYGILGPAAAFVLLGLVGIATMLAAALHGPALAGLGLAGSYVAPLLVSSARPSPWPVVVYLAVVAAAAMGLARLRRWLWLAALAVAGAVVWGLAFLRGIDAGDLDWTLAGYLHALVQLVLAAGFLAIAPNLGVREESARPDPVASGALAALAVLAILLLATGRYDLGSAVPFTLAAAAILMAAAWSSPPAAAGAVLAGLVVLAGVACWPGLAATPDKTLLAPAVAGVLRLPENVTGYMTFAALASLGTAVVAAFRLWRGLALRPATAGLYALAAAATPLTALVIVYLRVTQLDSSIRFALAGLVLAAINAAAADRFQKAELAELPGTRLVTGALAAAAIGALCFALVAALDRGYLTVALALTALGTALVAVRLDIPLLRHVVTVLALVVLARIWWNPRIMGAEVGRWPIVNWLLVGYAVPAASLWASARLLETKAPGLAVRVADAAAVLLAGLLFFFEIRHALNAGDVLAPTSSHIEQGLMAIVALGLSYALMRLDLGRANPVFYWGSIAFGVLAALSILVGLGLAHNPLIVREKVLGPTGLSSLALAYLLPGLGAVLLARACRPYRPRWYVTGIAVLASLMVFAYVTLEVRHAFQGNEIWVHRRTGAAEQWAYSAAWLLLGLVFLAYGIWRASLEARLASAALVLLSVAKVFLLDLGGLTGFWRALSFIVLGLVLIGIGLAYQNLVFARPAPRPRPSSGGPPAGPQ